MNAEKTMTIRNSFSIENILSKPHKSQLINRQCKSESVNECIENGNGFDEVTSITSGEIVLKKEPVHCATNDEHLIGHHDMVNINRSQFTSPDSSGCEEENADNLSDITTGDNCKWFWKRTNLFAQLWPCYQLMDMNYLMS